MLKFLLTGFLVGWVARAVMPGDQKMGMIRTTVLGILGAFAGVVIGNLASGRTWSEPNNIGFLTSVGGSLAVMVLARFLRGGSK
jgi:uncharacterized membrane protein YeaQ/YmgE (transglycosylase-associated protein family)